jgi:sulfur carrier protein
LELNVNGVVQRAPEGVTVVEVVAEVTTQNRGVAVAVNGEVVPRSTWPETRLYDGDRVEVLTAAQGG